MKKESQILRRARQCGQLLLLVSIFILGGLFLPAYIAPRVYSFLPVTTPYARQQAHISVSIAGRNAANGDTFQVAASSPDKIAQISQLEYSCQFDGVTLVYRQPDTNKELPCGTRIQLPTKSTHRLQVLTQRNRLAYVPIKVTVAHGERSREVSVVLVTAGSDVDARSRLPDRSTITLQTNKQ